MEQTEQIDPDAQATDTTVAFLQRIERADEAVRQAEAVWAARVYRAHLIRGASLAFLGAAVGVSLLALALAADASSTLLAFGAGYAVSALSQKR